VLKQQNKRTSISAGLTLKEGSRDGRGMIKHIQEHACDSVSIIILDHQVIQHDGKRGWGRIDSRVDYQGPSVVRCHIFICQKSCAREHKLRCVSCVMCASVRSELFNAILHVVEGEPYQTQPQISHHHQSRCCW